MDGRDRPCRNEAGLAANARRSIIISHSVVELSRKRDCPSVPVLATFCNYCYRNSFPVLVALLRAQVARLGRSLPEKLHPLVFIRHGRSLSASPGKYTNAECSSFLSG